MGMGPMYFIEGYLADDDFRGELSRDFFVIRKKHHERAFSRVDKTEMNSLLQKIVDKFENSEFSGDEELREFVRITVESFDSLTEVPH